MGDRIAWMHTLPMVICAKRNVNSFILDLNTGIIIQDRQVDQAFFGRFLVLEWEYT